MTKKTRLIIVLSCAGLFLIITPIIIFYSLGYRFDFETKKIVATGGIYIKASPLGTDVIVDSSADKKTGIFSTYVFVQNLLPKKHSVLIKKDGYFDYVKTLDVKENEVTKLENVTLFKKDIAFEALAAGAKSPFTELAAPKDVTLKNNNLYAKQTVAPMVKNVVAFAENGGLTWLAQDGFLYQSNLNGENVEKLSEVAITVGKKNTYEIFIFGKNIFLKENSDLLLLNEATKSFALFTSQIKDVKASPDGQKLMYWGDHTISIYYFENSKESYAHQDSVLLNTFSEKITDAYWVNDDYIIFNLEKSIVISEIDARANVNIITLLLPDSLKITPTTKILFNQSDKKLYILNGKETLVSEKLIP